MNKPSFLVAAMVAIALTACGKKEEPTPVATPAPAQQPAPAPVQDAVVEKAEDVAGATEAATEEAAEATQNVVEEARTAVEAAVDQVREAGEQAAEKAGEAVEEARHVAEAAVASALQAAGISTVAPLSPEAAENLAKEKNCMACHATDRKLVGPSYQEVAAKRAGEEGAVAMLAEKIKKGGAGAYGPVPMPPNPQVTDEEAAQLAQWVLSLQ